MLVNSIIENELFCQSVSNKRDTESSKEDGVEGEAYDPGVGDPKTRIIIF